MNYVLRDYNGMELTLTTEQASKIAAAAELIEVTVNGQTHYLNPKNIASIKPSQGVATSDPLRGVGTGNRVKGYGTLSSGF